MKAWKEERVGQGGRGGKDYATNLPTDSTRPMLPKTRIHLKHLAKTCQPKHPQLREDKERVIISHRFSPDGICIPCIPLYRGGSCSVHFPPSTAASSASLQISTFSDR